jgi:hypothetical protein
MNWRDWAKDRFEGVQDTLLGQIVLYSITSLFTAGAIYKFHDIFSQEYQFSIYQLIMIFIAGVAIPLLFSVIRNRVYKRKFTEKRKYGVYHGVGWECSWK